MFIPRPTGVRRSVTTLVAVGATVAASLVATAGAAEAAAAHSSARYSHPGIPTRVRTSRTDRTITLSWRAPRWHGGGPLKTYRIMATAPNGRAKHVSAGPSATRAVISGLRPSTRYAVQIRATNAAHRSTPVVVHVTTAYPPIPAQRVPAPVAQSHYLRRLNGEPAHDGPLMRAMGVADARANPRNHRYLNLLDIGAQAKGGVVLSATITFINYADLVYALESYLAGYASAQQYNAPAIIAVGTNNDGVVSKTTGLIWAQHVVAPLISWAEQHTRRITVAGANDIEPGFRATRTATSAWLSGFLAGGHAKFVFNGSADGCPVTTGKATCNHGWTTYDLHWLAGAASPKRILALPQIYNTDMPWQWQVISSVHKQHLVFGGPLTEHYACAQARSCYSVTNPRAWSMLYSALRSNPVTSVNGMPYGPDLRIS